MNYFVTSEGRVFTDACEECAMMTSEGIALNAGPTITPELAEAVALCACGIELGERQRIESGLFGVAQLDIDAYDNCADADCFSAQIFAQAMPGRCEETDNPLAFFPDPVDAADRQAANLAERAKVAAKAADFIRRKRTR